MKAIHTPRLLLRPFELNDFAAFHQLAYADPDVAPGWTGRTRTPDEVRASFARKVEQTPGSAGWLAITLKPAGTLIGGMGLLPWLPDEDIGWFIPERPEDLPRREQGTLEVELAYVFGRAHWGHGYATEAGHAVLNYGFSELGVVRIISPIDSANVRSINLARRLGCAIHRNLHPKPSPFRDTPGVIAVLSREDWLRTAGSTRGELRSES